MDDLSTDQLDQLVAVFEQLAEDARTTLEQLHAAGFPTDGSDAIPG